MLMQNHRELHDKQSSRKKRPVLLTAVAFRRVASRQTYIVKNLLKMFLVQKKVIIG